MNNLISENIIKEKYDNKIIGLLKFSSKEPLKDGTIPFLELQKGNIYFNDPIYFSKGDDLNTDQRALEGSVKSTVIKNWTNYQAVNDNIFQEPKGFKFIPQENIIKMIEPTKTNSFLGYRNNINLNSLPEYFNNAFITNCDIYLKPISYYRKLDFNKKSKKIITNYLIDNACLTYGNQSTCKIVCFTAVTSADITNGHLKDSFITELNGIRNYRDWVYINFNDFLEEIKAIDFDGLGAPITYYDNIYPLEQNQIGISPNKIFLVKPRKYQSQHEYRLIIGGPNEYYKNPYGNTVHLNWTSKIQFSNKSNNGVLRRIKI